MEKLPSNMAKPVDIELSGSLHRVHTTDVGQIEEVDAASVYRKVDWRIVPLMFLCYFLQFLDKVLVNYANIMGLQRDLEMAGQDFSWMATAFFIGYAVAEFPQAYLLQKFPVAKILGFNVLCWGITLCCTSGVQNFAGITALRTLLGCFEAIITPALILTTSMWYTKKQGAPRYGIWYCGLGAGQIIGGLISYAGQHGRTGVSFGGWRIMMMSVGVFNLVVAGAVLIWLPDSVSSAKFLTTSEKSFIQTRLVSDQSGTGKRVFKLSSLWETLVDLQVWLLFVLTVLIVIPSGVITTFSATLIRGFGFTPKTSALLNMPSGILSIFATLSCTFAVLKDFPRWLGIIVLMVPTMIGAGLMSFLTPSNRAGVLTGIYLINFDVAPLALIYALVGSNTQGYTKKVATNVLIAIAFSIANIIGPQTFQAREAPQYLGAKITIFGVCGGTIVFTILLRLLYGYRNTKAVKDSVSLDGNAMAMDGDEDLTDMTNPAFRYVY
ncbi:hypothetical protein LTS18_012841 [Coniosporium uncinatum]|uniref:Uncharacterized protein n=1 Tax=Coniosporium uncinatum TaxID=93489 RepID=A0ACC3DYG3_9PEZI|nr:hypothetical protein LTS18_012841 [Coniosporium uncinatum]